MLSARLIQMIEDHAEELTSSVIDDLRSNKLTTHYHHLSDHEVRQRTYDVYRHLGQWVHHETEGAIESTFSALGGLRYAEGVPVSEMVWALTLTKYHLRDYIHHIGLVDSAIELYQQQEFWRLVGHFFDKAVYHTVRGHEQAAAIRHQAQSKHAA